MEHGPLHKQHPTPKANGRASILVVVLISFCPCCLCSSVAVFDFILVCSSFSIVSVFFSGDDFWFHVSILPFYIFRLCVSKSTSIHSPALMLEQ